jgi:hypothetical protein
MQGTYFLFCMQGKASNKYSSDGGVSGRISSSAHIVTTHASYGLKYV